MRLKVGKTQLATLCLFRLLPAGFTSRDLREHLATLLGRSEPMTSSQSSYDLRRLRHHSLIPHTHRHPRSFAIG